MCDLLLFFHVLPSPEIVRLSRRLVRTPNPVPERKVLPVVVVELIVVNGVMPCSVQQVAAKVDLIMNGDRPHVHHSKHDNP